jgi:hypothetical protein
MIGKCVWVYQNFQSVFFVEDQVEVEIKLA